MMEKYFERPREFKLLQERSHLHYQVLHWRVFLVNCVVFWGFGLWVFDEVRGKRESFVFWDGRWEFWGCEGVNVNDYIGW
jgi:hypothetical protein